MDFNGILWWWKFTGDITKIYLKYNIIRFIKKEIETLTDKFEILFRGFHQGCLIIDIYIFF